MKWQLIGKEEMWDSGVVGKGHVYRIFLWRTPVPNGWLLMALNSRTNIPQPTTSFYPDPAHTWNPAEDPESTYLLRAAGPGMLEADPTRLLRASNEPDDETGTPQP